MGGGTNNLAAMGKKAFGGGSGEKKGGRVNWDGIGSGLVVDGHTWWVGAGAGAGCRLVVLVG